MTRFLSPNLKLNRMIRTTKKEKVYLRFKLQSRTSTQDAKSKSRNSYNPNGLLIKCPRFKIIHQFEIPRTTKYTTYTSIPKLVKEIPNQNRKHVKSNRKRKKNLGKSHKIQT